MGVRKSWHFLSTDYRVRLERHGINEANHATASLGEIRGHGPDRQQLINEIWNYKVALHGAKPKFNAKRSFKNITIDTETGKRRTNKELRAIAKAYRNNISEGYSAIFYQLNEDGTEDADKYH
jgi:hypothetical protein